MKNFLSKRKLLIAFFLLAIIKQLMTRHIPIYPLGNAGTCDDLLMIRLAKSLIGFQWLGPYDWLTHAKGAGFPLFLAASNLLGIDYITASNTLYALSCVAFAIALRPVFKRDWALLLFYAVLLFNPASYGFQTLQRVYRNGITISMTLFVFAGILAMYLRPDQRAKRLLPWAFLSGFFLAWLWNTREDSVWILPFVLTATVILLVTGFVRCQTWRLRLHNTLLSLVPLASLAAGILLVSAVNYVYYGQFVTTDMNGSTPFCKAMASIYAVKPASADPTDNLRVSVSSGTIERLYEISPSLGSMSQQLDEEREVWSTYDLSPDDGEVETGMFLWCLRDALSVSGGYSSPQNAAAFYENVHLEIEQAFAQGKLERRATMPSALMAPFPSGSLGALMKNMLTCALYVARFQDVAPQEIANTDNPDLARQFETVTLNLSNNQGLAPYATIPYAKTSTRICKIVCWIYQRLGLPLFVLGLLCYLILMFLPGKKGASSSRNSMIRLILTGIIASLIVMYGGVAYSHLTAFESINSLYLSCAYPLVSAFSLLSVAAVIQSAASSLRAKSALQP